MKFLVGALLFATKVAAECPNACSGHGVCGAFDECTCYHNYQGGDCSYKTCPFSLGHVDSPKGDLDGSADALSGIDDIVLMDSTVYPYGTFEQYPRMEDSQGKVLENTAHAYVECGNKGICDRGSGECECFAGYEGAACQRASCPDPLCSGHGTCQSAAELAAMDYDNVYLLWDKDVTMGCKCEPGYKGPSCADKICKYGVDPLYIDDPYMSIRAPTARVSIKNKNVIDTHDRATRYLEGTYAIKFYDVFGEDYETAPISVNASCPTIVAALEALPQRVIPEGTMECTQSLQYVDEEMAYDLEFHGTPGDLKPIEINLYLDGTRPSVYVVNGTTYDFQVEATVIPNKYGVSGEFIDYFSEYCHNVEVTMALDTTESKKGGIRGVITGLDTAESKLLKKCLGDANGDLTDNKEVYDWDYGLWNETLFPHIVKLAPTPDYMDDDYDAGRFYLIWYDKISDTFFTGNLPHDTTKSFTVFTTEGVATVMTNITNKERFNGIGVDAPGQIFYGDVTARFDEGSSTIYTSVDTSCYTGSLATCLNKGDKIFLFEANWITGVTNDGTAQTSAEYTGNMYTVMKIGVDMPSADTYDTEDRYYIILDKPTNWDGSATMDYETLYPSPHSFANLGEDLATKQVGTQRIIKFEPSPTEGNYEYVSECSGRGLCDSATGLCECFAGYTNDNCDSQNALSV